MTKWRIGGVIVPRQNPMSLTVGIWKLLRSEKFWQMREILRKPRGKTRLDDRPLLLEKCVYTHKVLICNERCNSASPRKKKIHLTQFSPHENLRRVSNRQKKILKFEISVNYSYMFQMILHENKIVVLSWVQPPLSPAYCACRISWSQHT